MKCKIDIKLFTIIIFSLTALAFQYSIGLTPSQERGKQIYTKGTRSSGESILAKLSGAQFDAKILPCINCHGERGGGNPEGGVIPSPLDWSSLTKSYNVEFKNGRKRVGYNAQFLKLAIEQGIDPSGNELDMVMPRYTLNDEDIEDLISYLKIIDIDEITGVTDSSIHMGIILPSRSQSSGRSKAIAATVRAYMNILNSGGGLYNRKFYLSEFYSDPPSEKLDDALPQFIDSSEVFAFIGSDLSGLTPSALNILEEKNIPVIGLISGEPRKDEYIKSNFYYLFSGLENEVKKLLEFASHSLNASENEIAVVYDSKSSISESGMIQRLASQDILLVDISAEGSTQQDILSKLKKDTIESCIFLGSTIQGISFMEDAKAMNWYPNVLVPGKLATPQWFTAPLETNGKVYFSYPTWNSARNEQAMEQYKIMASNYNLKDQFLNAQLNSLSAAILFTEVLKLVGREISQDAMLNTLNEMRQFESGFIPPLTFGANKRVGSEEVFIVKLDLEKNRLVQVFQTMPNFQSKR